MGGGSIESMAGQTVAGGEQSTLEDGGAVASRAGLLILDRWQAAKQAGLHTLRTCGPEPDVPVEYESMATRGVMPKVEAVSADTVAICTAGTAGGQAGSGEQGGAQEMVSDWSGCCGCSSSAPWSLPLSAM